MSENLNQALAKATAEIPELKYDAVNPHFGNQYLSLKGLLNQVLPVLRANDLLLIQSPSTAGEQAALTTRIVHVPTGEEWVDVMLLSATKQDPQAQGSAITYARRYAIMSMLGLVAEEDDDDGNAASGGGSSSTLTKSTSKRSSGDRGRKMSSDGTSKTGPSF